MESMAWVLASLFLQGFEGAMMVLLLARLLLLLLECDTGKDVVKRSRKAQGLVSQDLDTRCRVTHKSRFLPECKGW